MKISKFFIRPENTIFVIIDIQEKLVNAMPEDVVEKVIYNNILLVELCKTYKIPVLLTEQYPKGLGKTIDRIKEILPEYNPIEKISFNACLEPLFLKALKALRKTKIILTGIETHICVYQTALALLSKGYTIYVPKDAVCSRKKQNWKTGLDLMNSAGVIVTDTETLVFQILEKAGTQEFKKIVKYIK